METHKNFDLESVYDSQIAPLMSQIIEICKREGIPILASFCYRADIEGTDDGVEDFCTTHIPRGGRGGWSPRKFGSALRELYQPGPSILAITITQKDG